jgi:hypothetical protein
VGQGLLHKLLDVGVGFGRLFQQVATEADNLHSFHLQAFLVESMFDILFLLVAAI